MIAILKRTKLLYKHTPSNRHIWKLSWPVFLSMMTVPVVMITDTIMIGRLDSISLAAAAQGGVLFWVVASFYIGLGIGVQVMVARRFGEKNHRQAGHILSISLWISIIGGIACSIIGWIVMPWVASIVSANEFVNETILFSRYRFLGLPLYFSVFIFRGFFDGISKPIVGLIASIVIMISNFLLNLILIFGLNNLIQPLGLQGAAIATSLAAIPGLLIHVISILKPTFRVYFTGKPLSSFKDTLLNVIKSGMPTAVEQSITNLSFVVFFSIAARLGTTQTAISGIILNVMSLSFMPGYALGTASATILGQSIARGKIKLAIHSVWKSAHLAALLMTTVGILFIIFADEIFHIFRPYEKVSKAGILALYIISVFQIFDAYQMVLSAALRSAGEGLVVLFGFSFLSYLFFIPLTYLLSIKLKYGLQGLWLGLGLYLTSLAIFFVYRFQSRKWIGKSI